LITGERLPPGFFGNSSGAIVAPLKLMKEPSEARKRTIALQQRAIRFSVNICRSCPPAGLNIPSSVVWNQLVRAADGASNNLVEADDASSEADFLNKMRLALRETKEARTCVQKIKRADLANAGELVRRELEEEADELAAIFASIIMNMERRLAGRKAARSGSKL
jgi:four helix bundle protein